MITYIALLRGINVGGNKKIPMVELREILGKVGLINAQTYIQSGNVIFQTKEIEIKALEHTIQKAIMDHFGFEVPVLVLSPKDLKQVFDECPFSEEQKTNSYFMLLYKVPDKDLVEEVSKISYPNEEFAITKNCVYIFYSLGVGKAKLGVNWFERKLKITATARNYKTMVKLLSLSADN